MSLLMVLITFGNIFIPIFQQNIIDDGLLGNNVGFLITLVVSIIVISLITNLSTLIQSYLRIDLNAVFLKDKQKEIFNHAIKLKIEYIKNDGLIQIIKNAEYSLNNISQVTGNQISDTLIQIFKFIGVFIGLCIINWKLTLFLLLSIPVRWFITNILSKYVEKYQMDTIMTQKVIHGWEDDIYHSATEIKLWNLYDKKNTEYDDLLEKRNTAVKKMGKFTILSSLLGDSVGTIFFNVLYIIGGFFIWGGTLSIGGMLAFISYANYLMEPIGFISELKMVLSEVGPSLDTYDQFLNYEEEQTNKQEQEKMKCVNIDKPSFKFDNVSFSFKDRLIFGSINMDFIPGDRIALIGENGSGKSTLINLLLRLYELQGGNIILNNNTILDYELFSYRNMFSVIMQNPYLFNGTIMDNLSMFGSNKLEDTLLNCELLDFINKLPDKFNTNIGNNASHISGGEKQKIALIRALAADSKVLILDEPTSAYDKKSEKDFIEIIKKCNKDIVIMITHQPELLRATNKIIEIKDEKIKIYTGYRNYLVEKENIVEKN